MTGLDHGCAGLPVDTGTGFLRLGNADGDPPHFQALREWFGFLPNLALPRLLLPRLVEAEVAISAAFLFRERALTRTQKELVLLVVAAIYENKYEAALRYRMLSSVGFTEEHAYRILFDYSEAGLPEPDVALLDFASRLVRHPTRISQSDIETLRGHGFTDECILEAVLTTSWGSYLCTLSAGLGVEHDLEPPNLSQAVLRDYGHGRPHSRWAGEPRRPYLRTRELSPQFFPPFAFVKEKWGFIPRLFQAQTLWPDLVEAELRAIDLWLLTNDVLSQRRKEYIFLAVSAVNLNTYCVAAHCEVLRGLGVPEEQSTRIALDHHEAGLSGEDEVLIDVCLKLTRDPNLFCEADVEVLRRHAFSEAQILEAITIVAVANFINMLNIGLGVEPDFPPKIDLLKQKVHPFSAAGDPMDEASPERAEGGPDDPDADYVAKVQAGESEAFEALVRKHGRRVQRTLAGILRRDDEIEDAVQDTFLKAFQNIRKFQGRSTFATWLTRIAVNTGLQRLRRRREVKSLDTPEEDYEFRPREVRAWDDDPEQSHSKAEIRRIVWEALNRLPLKYRTVVMLRDFQQLSTKETASALGLRIPAVKIRLLRGRLMLREALSPYFASEDKYKAHV